MKNREIEVKFLEIDKEALVKKLAELEVKIDAVYKSAEKTRKYFLWTLIISAVFVILPLVGLMLIIPQFTETLNVVGDLDL